MKTVWFYKHVFLWAGIVGAGIFLPRVARAADCESNVKAAFQKKNLDTEMKVISGELSDFEAAGTREQIQLKLKRDKETCSRRLAASRAESETASF